MPDTIGLKQRIGEAKNADEVNTLLREGKAYKFVSDRTVRQWQKVSKLRLQELKKEISNDQKESDS